MLLNPYLYRLLLLHVFCISRALLFPFFQSYYGNWILLQFCEDIIFQIAGPNSTLKWKITLAPPLNYRALIYFDIILEISTLISIFIYIQNLVISYSIFSLASRVRK